MLASSARRISVRPALRAAALAGRSSYATASVFKNEPAKPAVKTSLPGPKSKEAIGQLDTVFDTRSINMLVDYSKCNGN